MSGRRGQRDESSAIQPDTVDMAIVGPLGIWGCDHVDLALRGIDVHDAVNGEGT